MAERLNLNGDVVNPMGICVIGARGFIGSHLCEKLMRETEHHLFALTVNFDALNRDEDGERISYYNLVINKTADGLSTDLLLLEELIGKADLVINLCETSADYNLHPRDKEYRDFIDMLPVARYCKVKEKRLLHFSFADVYGMTPRTITHNNLPIYAELSPQEAYVFAEAGLNCTLVRPFNWIGPRMDVIPGIDGPFNGLLCYNLIRGETLKLVHGGESLRTYLSITEAIEAVLLMIENPLRCGGFVFEVGNPENEATVKAFAEMTARVFSEIKGEDLDSTLYVSAKSEKEEKEERETYGEPYDSVNAAPDTKSISQQLQWMPKTSMYEMLHFALSEECRADRGKIKADQVEENRLAMRNRVKASEEDKTKQAAQRWSKTTSERRGKQHAATKVQKSNQFKGVGDKTLHAYF